VVNLGAPVKENMPPSNYKPFTTIFISLAVIHVDAPVIHSFTSGSHGLHAEEFLPPPLSLTSILRV
jgi:hypothetical protein